MQHISKRRDLNKLKKKTICKFPSIKGDVPVVLTEGTLEKDFCYYLEFDDNVIEYQCQPLGYYYYMEDGRHSYTPDFKVQVKTDSGIAIVYYEIKERKYLADDFSVEFEAKQWPPQNVGIELILVDDLFIRQQPRLSNLKRVYAAKRREQPEHSLIIKVKEAFHHFESMSAQDLINEADLSIGEIYQLIFFKVLEADFDEPFGPEMILWSNSNG